MLNLKHRLFSGGSGRSSFPKAAGWCEPWPLISYHELLPLLSIRVAPPCRTTPALLLLCLRDVKRLPCVFHPAGRGGHILPPLSVSQSPQIKNPSALKMHKRLSRSLSGKHTFLSNTSKIGHLEDWLSLKFLPIRHEPDHRHNHHTDKPS